MDWTVTWCLAGRVDGAVLGTRLDLLGWSWAGIAPLTIAYVFWLTLLTPVLSHWVTPTIGLSLVLTRLHRIARGAVRALAAGEHANRLIYAALAPFGLGLAFYAFVIQSFDLRQLVVGRGDHWITGGALAISTLAAGRVTLAAHSLHQLTGLAEALKTISIVLWVLTIAWLPVLLITEALRPRLGYDVRRWSTVFPVGMYAACSFIVGAVAHAPTITDFARVWIWAGVAVWLLVFVAMIGRGIQLTRAEHPPISAKRVEEISPSRRRAP